VGPSGAHAQQPRQHGSSSEVTVPEAVLVYAQGYQRGECERVLVVRSRCLVSLWGLTQRPSVCLCRRRGQHAPTERHTLSPAAAAAPPRARGGRADCAALCVWR
jgi:hypothetical protein